MHDTQEYITQKPGLYNLSFAPKAEPLEVSRRAGSFVAGCQRQLHVSGSVVDTYNQIRSQVTRPAPRPQTEIVSTSVYKMDGMGYHRHIDVANTLQRDMTARSKKCYSRDQESFFRRPPCLRLPSKIPLEDLPRGGVSTRVLPYRPSNPNNMTMC